MALPPRKPTSQQSREEQREQMRHSAPGKLLIAAGFTDPVHCTADLWKLAQHVAGPINPADHPDQTDDEYADADPDGSTNRVELIDGRVVDLNLVSFVGDVYEGDEENQEERTIRFDLLMSDYSGMTVSHPWGSDSGYAEHRALSEIVNSRVDPATDTDDPGAAQ